MGKVFSQNQFGIYLGCDQFPGDSSFSKTTQFGFFCGHVLLITTSTFVYFDDHLLIDFEFRQKQNRYKDSSAHKQRPFEIVQCTIYSASIFTVDKPDEVGNVISPN